MSVAIVEVRAAEGGADARDLVRVQVGIYANAAKALGFGLEVVEEADGFAVLRVVFGFGTLLFDNEAGGHRFQRVPPTERKGRVHTSTITVAVLPEPPADEFVVPAGEIEVRTTKGSGPGGQHRNKVESCVVVTHRPTGMTVRADCGRSQHRNRELALGLLRARLAAARAAGDAAEVNAARRAMIGSGQRGDKRRTIRYQDGVVTDHVLRRKMPLDAYLAGRMFR